MAAKRALLPEPDAETQMGQRPASALVLNAAWYSAEVMPTFDAHGPMCESTNSSMMLFAGVTLTSAGRAPIPVIASKRCCSFSPPSSTASMFQAILLGFEPQMAQ